MEKKEFYRQALPHFQQTGQAYFVTWCLKDAVPPKALVVYTRQLNELKSSIEISKRNNISEKMISDLKFTFYIARKKYMKAYDDLLHLQTKFIVNLSNDENTKIVLKSLCFWEGKRIQNYAICVMSNHVHWVFRVLENDENGDPIYLQDILQSVKRFSANKINKLENLSGTLWQGESYDTTICDELHLHNAINYTLNNPVSAGLVKNWWEWKGTMYFEN
ncbi:MAG: transposase [Paludibacter sp.]